MRVTFLATAVAAFLVSTLASAQTPANITGTWRLNANNHQGDLIVTQAPDGTLSGTMYGDPIRGYHASTSRWFIILRGSLNNPFQAFVGLVRRNGLEASGTFYALDASRGGGSTSRNVFNFFAARNRTSYPGDPGQPTRSAGPADIGGYYRVDANGHIGQLELYQRAGGGLTGSIYDEQVVGYYASGTGSIAFLRIRSGQPFQFFGGYTRSSGGVTQLTGTFYPITATGGASPQRVTYRWTAGPLPPPPPPPPPPSPSISLNVMPQSRSVQWGNSTSYQITLQGQNNLNGNVMLELRGSGSSQVPGGITYSFTPNPVGLSPQNPNATAGLNINTVATAVAPGNVRLQVRATSPGVATRTRNMTLSVTRTPGVFIHRPTSSSPMSTCGNNIATATYQNIGTAANPDIRVRFSVPPGGPSNSTPAIPAVFYLFSPPPACVGVALHPLTGVTGQPVPPALSWFNLGFSQNLGAPTIPGRIKNLVNFNWHQFWFSQDQTLLLLVTKLPLQTPSSPQSYRLFLYDAATGLQINRTDILPRSVGATRNPIADICRVELNAAGDEVTVTYRDRQNQPSSCPFSNNTTDCQTGTPQNCRVSTRNLNL